MSLRICVLIGLLFVFSFVSGAQTENFETTENPQSIKIVEFGLTGDCEKGAIVDTIYIELLNRKDWTAYVIGYRGTDDLPSRQTEEYLQGQFNWMRKSIAFRKYDSSRIVFVDGGFRKSDGYISEVWIVPQGGIVPQPTETVSQPKLRKDKTYLADKDNDNFIIESAQIIERDYEVESQEIDTEISENENNELEETDTESDSSVSDEEPEEEPQFFSKYFGDTLRADFSLKGTIIYYADDESYDLGKARQLMEAELQKFTTKFEINPNRITLVYGGYRESSEIEFWIIPKGAKEPQPKPEVKKIEEEN